MPPALREVRFKSSSGRPAPNSVQSTAQLRHNAGDVAHAPMFGDQPVLYAEDVARGEAQRLAGRRDAEIGAVMRARIDEARRDMILVADHGFDRDF